MTKTLLVIITGPPCTGKTTLARRIARELGFPLITKDDIKESLFDSLGWKDRERSKQLGRASYELLFYFVESQLAAGRSHIVEANLAPEFSTERLRALKTKYRFEPFQIQCKTDGQVLVQRFKERAKSGVRHPGHVEHLQHEEQSDILLKGKYESLDIGGQVLEIDTTDFTIDYAGLFQAIRSAANSKVEHHK
jgi:predicted kinase